MQLNDKYKAKGLDTLGPFGVPCTSEQAKQWERSAKDWEKEGLGFKRATTYTTAEVFTEGEWADVSVINDLTIDRDSEIVLPKGANLDQFNKYGPITLNHDYSRPPVGRSAWVKFEPSRAKAERIKMKAIYAPRPKDYPADVEWEPEKIFGLIRQGFLTGKSIGFIAESARAPTQKEIDTRPELSSVKRIIDKFTLLEVAVATVPSNPAALTEAVSKGIVQKSLLDSLGIPVIELPEAEFVSCWQWEADTFNEGIATRNEIRKAIAPKLARPAYAKRWTDVARQLSQRIKIDEDTILKRMRGMP